MIRYAFAAFAFALVLTGTPACGAFHPPPNLTPQAQAAWRGDKVGRALDAIRDIAQDANAQGLLSTDTARKITIWHKSIRRTLDELPVGWVSLVETALSELKRDLPPNERRLLGRYIDLATVALTETL